LCGLLAYIATSAIMNGPTRCGNKIDQTPFGAIAFHYYSDSRGNVTAVCLPHFLPRSIRKEWTQILGPRLR
jgi:hypothetical protein